MSDKIFSYKRLTNLTECELVVRHSNRYQVTDQGRAWFKGPMESAVDDPRKNIIDGVNHYNHQQKQGLRDQLAAMDPYQFEALIGEL